MNATEYRDMVDAITVEHNAFFNKLAEKGRVTLTPGSEALAFIMQWAEAWSIIAAEYDAQSERIRKFRELVP